MALSRSLPLAGLLLGPIAAQAPSFSTFGNPCGPVPPLAALNLPRVGQVFQLQVLSSESVTPGSYDGNPVTSVLVAGLSNTVWQGVPWTAAAFQALGVGACGDLSVAADATRTFPYLWPRAPITGRCRFPTCPHWSAPRCTSRRSTTASTGISGSASRWARPAWR